VIGAKSAKPELRTAEQIGPIGDRRARKNTGTVAERLPGAAMG